MKNPYDPPKAPGLGRRDEREGFSWLSRILASVLWAGAAFIVFVFVFVFSSNYYRNYDTATRNAVYAVFICWPLAWAPAGYWFWKGTRPKLSWLLVFSPAIVLVVATMMVVLVSEARPSAS